MDEGLVAVEEAVPAGEEVALEPALAKMLGEDLHDPAVAGKALVGGEGLGLPGPVGDLEDVVEPVRGGLVGAEEPEGLRVALDPQGQVLGLDPGRLGAPWAIDGDHDDVS